MGRWRLPTGSALRATFIKLLIPSTHHKPSARRLIDAAFAPAQFCDGLGIRGITRQVKSAQSFDGEILQQADSL